MSFPVKKFKEIVLQLLFSMDMGESSEEDLVPFLMEELAVTRRIVREAHAKALEILEKKEELDQQIESTSETYALERIGRVERNILRQGIFELIYSSEVPPEAIISEAIRLTRKFGTPESANFVNALMDAILKVKQASKSQFIVDSN